MRQASRLVLTATLALLSLTWTLQGRQIRTGIAHAPGSVVSMVAARLRAVSESSRASEPILLLFWGALLTVAGGKVSLFRSSRLRTPFRTLKSVKAIAARSGQRISVQGGDNVLDGSAKLPVCAE